MNVSPTATCRSSRLDPEPRNARRLRRVPHSGGDRWHTYRRVFSRRMPEPLTHPRTHHSAAHNYGPWHGARRAISGDMCASAASMNAGYSAPPPPVVQIGDDSSAPGGFDLARHSQPAVTVEPPERATPTAVRAPTPRSPGPLAGRQRPSATRALIHWDLVSRESRVSRKKPSLKWRTQASEGVLWTQRGNFLRRPAPHAAT